MNKFLEKIALRVNSSSALPYVETFMRRAKRVIPESKQHDLSSLRKENRLANRAFDARKRLKDKKD